MPHDWRPLSIGVILLAIVAPLSVNLLRRIASRNVDVIGGLVFGLVLLCGFVFGVQLTLDGAIGKQLVFQIRLSAQRISLRV